MPFRDRLSIATILFIVLAVTGAATLSTAGVGAQETDEAESNGNETESNVTITVGATGTVSAPPDLAVIDVAVEATAGSPDAAREAVAENVSEMREGLIEANVSDDQMRTAYFTIQEERDDNETVTYRAIHGFELRVPVDDAGSVTETAVASGATRVGGVQFTLTEETSRELRNDALEEALTSARIDANVIASATGIEVQSMRSVETADGSVGPVFVEDARDGGTTFDPGPVTVTAHVTVTYEAS